MMGTEPMLVNQCCRKLILWISRTRDLCLQFLTSIVFRIQTLYKGAIAMARSKKNSNVSKSSYLRAVCRRISIN